MTSRIAIVNRIVKALEGFREHLSRPSPRTDTECFSFPYLAFFPFLSCFLAPPSQGCKEEQNKEQLYSPIKMFLTEASI